MEARSPELSRRDTTYTLIGVLLALFLGATDQTIVATALPAIAADLDGLSRYAWVATAYLLSATALVPIYRRLADAYSRKHIEVFSILVFLAGSLLCGMAGELGALPILGDGMNQLIVFRAVQGIGGAGIFATAFIVIADLFPPSVRGTYQGLVGATFGVASVLGPWLGGVLTDHAGSLIAGVEGWRWVFYANVPIGAVALGFIGLRMPRLDPHGERRPLDRVGAGLLVTGLVALVLALQLDKSAYPWNGSVTLGGFAIATLSLVAFTVRSLRTTDPILDLRLFRNPVFAISNLAKFFFGAVFLCAVILLPLFLVQVVGVSATRAGLSIVPLSLGTVAGAVLSGLLATWTGRYRPMLLIGAAILGAGVWLLGTVTAETTYATVTIYMIVVGIGIGPSFQLYTLAVQNAVDVRLIGQATSAGQFFRQIGGTVGTAVMGTVLSTTLTASLSGAVAVSGAPALSLDAASTDALRSGAEPSALIVRRLDAEYDRLAAAVRSEDPAAMERTLRESAVVAPDAHDLILTAAASARGDPERTRRLLELLRSELTAAGEGLADALTDAVVSGTTRATRTIFRALVWAVLAGAVATLFLPALTLRTTSDAEAAGTPPSRR